MTVISMARRRDVYVPWPKLFRAHRGSCTRLIGTVAKPRQKEKEKGSSILSGENTGILLTFPHQHLGRPRQHNLKKRSRKLESGEAV